MKAARLGETVPARFAYLASRRRPDITIIDMISAVVPKDGQSRHIALDLAYGPQARQCLDIYAPSAHSETRRPVIVFFYGGAWSSGARRHYAFAARALAQLGYLVVVPDYRLVPEIAYPVFLQDCAEAVGWTYENIESYGGDPTRLVLAGHSAGAYNAAMLALDREWLRPAIHGAIVGVIGLSGPYDFYPFDSPISRQVFAHVGDPLATQPINHVSAEAPPMLLVSGARDNLVLPRNSVHLGAALHRYGVRAEGRIYPGLGHIMPLLSLSMPLRWRASILDDCARFLSGVTSPERIEAVEQT